ncbi:hypothetical protein [Microlunatus sagamiharensis]|uniref:hypothetical protein n=1 Tax=Microlunatus sagamiharensis TaxID=546874 RepID=UPI000B84E7F3|nr:hypothetical protein [Microlunatus sagamiharensis]
MLPHPAFRAHFTDAIYDSDLAANDDTLPFGTDEGSDTLSEWSDGAAVLQADPRLDVVLGFKATALAREAADDDDSADQLIVAGFVLLRAAGTITSADQRLLLKVLRRQAEQSSDEGYQTMLDDLSTFPPQGASTPPRQAPSKPRPWIVIAGGWNDPPHARWLRRIARSVLQDHDWTTWWTAAPIERLVLMPRPVGHPGRPFHFERRGRTLEVIGSSAELTALFNRLEEAERRGEQLDPSLSTHQLHPDAPRWFRELILSLSSAAAEYLDMPPPPPTLPGTRG